MVKHVGRIVRLLSEHSNPKEWRWTQSSVRLMWQQQKHIFVSFCSKVYANVPSPTCRMLNSQLQSEIKWNKNKEWKKCDTANSRESTCRNNDELASIQGHDAFIGPNFYFQFYVLFGSVLFCSALLCSALFCSEVNASIDFVLFFLKRISSKIHISY